MALYCLDEILKSIVLSGWMRYLQEAKTNKIKKDISNLNRLIVKYIRPRQQVFLWWCYVSCQRHAMRQSISTKAGCEAGHHYDRNGTFCACIKNCSELKCSKNIPYKFPALHIDNFLFSCYSSFILKKQIPISHLKRRCKIGKEGEQDETFYETFFVGVDAFFCSFTDCLR